MNTPISPELSAPILKDAESYVKELNYYPGSDEYKDLVQAYIDAATPYAARWEQAKKALERIDEIHNPRNKIQYKEFVALVKTIAANTLATWKEEKGGNHG